MPVCTMAIILQCTNTGTLHAVLATICSLICLHFYLWSICMSLREITNKRSRKTFQTQAKIATGRILFIHSTELVLYSPELHGDTQEENLVLASQFYLL